MFRSIRSRLALSFAGIALVAAVVLGAVLLATLQRYYLNQEFAYLRGNARFVGGFVTDMTSKNAPHDEVQSQIENLAFLTQTRIQVFDVNQQMLYDSGSPQWVNVNLGVMKQMLATQPNGNLPSNTIRVITVNVNPPGKLPLLDPTPEANSIYIYRSIQAAGSPFGFDLNAGTSPTAARSKVKLRSEVVDSKNGNALGAVVLSEGPGYGSDILTSVARGWMLASAIAVLLAAAVGWFISRRISAPVLALTNVTTRMATGDLSSRAKIQSRDEFGQLANSFNEMADQVETTVVALRRFVSDAAHELHTPLTALRTNLDLAADNAADRQLFIERAQTTVKRMEELTNDLLDLSRLEATGTRQSDTAIELTALIRQRAEVYASQAEQAGLVFEMELPDNQVPIRADVVSVQRALDNLVDNACKFTPQGGQVSVQLTVGNARRSVPTANSEQCEVSVSDTGIGIPQDDLSQLFNRFHRGRNATAYPGSGLGLAIVKAIMEHQGGEVSVENMARGARFSLKWPVAGQGRQAPN